MPCYSRHSDSFGYKRDHVQYCSTNIIPNSATISGAGTHNDIFHRLTAPLQKQRKFPSIGDRGRCKSFFEHTTTSIRSHYRTSWKNGRYPSFLQKPIKLLSALKYSTKKNSLVKDVSASTSSIVHLKYMLYFFGI